MSSNAGQTSPPKGDTPKMDKAATPPAKTTEKQTPIKSVTPVPMTSVEKKANMARKMEIKAATEDPSTFVVAGGEEYDPNAAQAEYEVAEAQAEGDGKSSKE